MPCNDCSRAETCPPCVEEDPYLPDVTVSKRTFWWPGANDMPWWKPIILDGIRGGDENCNRTIGINTPWGQAFICLNIPLRQKPCTTCLTEDATWRNR
jgi:hypothetical protein